MPPPPPPLRGTPPILILWERHNSQKKYPAEPVDEAEYLDEVEREAREFFCHGYFNIMHELDTVVINLTIRIPQMAHS